MTNYDFVNFATAQAAKSGTVNVKGVLTSSELTMVKAHLEGDGLFAVVYVDNWHY